MPGYFITFEGPDGSGKTTQVDMLGRALAGRRPLLVREPGGTPLGERIREILLHTDGPLAPEAEMHLFMAARAQLVADVIRPALAEGRIVIADRYHDSTLAYQGGARGVEAGWPDYLPRPDLTFLLAVEPAAGRARQEAAGKPADRMESAGDAFHAEVAAAYDRLAAAEPERWVRLDAHLPAEAMHAQVMEKLAARLQETRA